MCCNFKRLKFSKTKDYKRNNLEQSALCTTFLIRCKLLFFGAVIFLIVSSKFESKMFQEINKMLVIKFFCYFSVLFSRTRKG